MQTVPSLIGTGTAIAAAASGLAFGEAFEPDDAFTTRPVSYSTRRQHSDESRARGRESHAPSSGPGTSCANTSTRQEGPHQPSVAPAASTVSRPPLSRYQRPKTSQPASTRIPSRQHSASRPADLSMNIAAETPRTSFSSSGSWYRRLSVRPSSQHDSPRSSVGPDSSSIAFSHGSSAPILSKRAFTGPPPTPNKLVKRTPSSAADDSSATSRPRSRSHLPTLRRPATSHQRSATLNLQSRLEIDTHAASSRNSVDRPLSFHGLLSPPLIKEDKDRSTSAWASFFHSRTSSTGGRTVGRVNDHDSQGRYNSTKRVQVFGNDHRQRAHLVKPSMVIPPSNPTPGVCVPADIEEEVEKRVETMANSDSLAEDTPARKARKSISMTFTQASDWMSRTSGSLRRPKRGDTVKGGSKRHVSEPLTSTTFNSGRRANTAGHIATAARPQTSIQGQSFTLGSKTYTQTRKRNTSSPAPPLSTFPSFNADLPISKSSGALAQNLRQNQPSGSSTSSTAMSQLRVPHHERTSSALGGSESDARDFMSGDEEDTDFKSDTMFDSLRTGASSHGRAAETPLDSMYDESPPSTGGTNRAKRLSIQEILGKDWDGSDRILEEDENAQTPVRTSRGLGPPFPLRDISDDNRISTESGLSSKEVGRFSLDDDFDDDWARDDDAPYNALSPPSKGSSINSKSINPNVRLALASVSGNSLGDSISSGNRTERPISNLFEWSESSVHQKQDGTNGSSVRPQTAHAKQEVDARGGRSAIRKGPAPTHVRSQSVPVVHEAPEESKPTGSKYGTWGLGTKTISEDWGDDFELGVDLEDDEKSSEKLFSVPESIQASQPSVRAHSGQIRELSLLVNDLQQLCRRGRELTLLDGPLKSLWKEAEGIIALASPDDDELEADRETTSSIDLDAFDLQDRQSDDDFEPASFDEMDTAFDGHEPVMSKTAVVRERPSPRRRSVFSPDDDIFGGSWPSDDYIQSSWPSRPRTPEPKLSRTPDVNGVVRSVVEVMQQRSLTEAWLEGANSNKKMHFDTNSLRILVKRARDLRDILSDTIRRADPITQSPVRTPRHERQLESSPAFTKVFDDPASSPPHRHMRSRGNTAIAEKTSAENSPSSNIGRRMQMMTVS